jgi:Ras-related protein Rab-11A
LPDICIKVIIIGDSNVGKSNIMLRFTTNDFSNEIASTIGVEFMTKSFIFNGQNYKLQIWDTAGQERFRAISRNVYKDSMCVLLVYDITNKESFEHVIYWLNEIKVYIDKNTPIFLIGNKSDLEQLRKIKTEIGYNFAKENNLLFFETSALEKINIDIVFETIIKHINKIDLQCKTTTNTISIITQQMKSTDNSNKKCKC